ncbi:MULTISPECIES: prepilin peptidase [Pseudomonas]|uniref:prepilin peptidase n=1 Tax=Pseudomonas TaxID=286 RepID=UPI000CD5A040|nr:MULTISPECIES: prepilin peptidase [Pseudomonas]RBH53307.1 prepilin peptidase [Pseudomonas sp. MWU13-2860]
MHSLVLAAWLALCATQDLRHRQIANSLTLGSAVLALVYLLWTGSTWLGAPAAQGGIALLLALLLTLPGYATRRMGAADVKLLSALALASEPSTLLGTFIGAGAAMLLWHWLAPRVWPLLGQGTQASLHHLAPETLGKRPFAPFLLIGLLGMSINSL